MRVHPGGFRFILAQTVPRLPHRCAWWSP